MRLSCFGFRSGVYRWASMPQEIASTSSTAVFAARYSAAFSVGVVTRSASLKVRAAAAHAIRVSVGLNHFGITAVYSSRFSGMKWLVAMTRMPRLRPSIAMPRPTTMWDWKCTTSGLTASRMRAELRLIRHGRAKRTHGCGYQRHE